MRPSAIIGAESAVGIETNSPTSIKTYQIKLNQTERNHRVKFN